ncbi:MAG: hypothetical protein KAT17_00605 [Candidatus Aminicenantes bacterium]|nr:hypothetical protein [Candidatus Aminicenantes bacterium]
MSLKSLFHFSNTFMVIVWFAFLFIWPLPQSALETDLKKLYWDSSFKEIVNHFDKKNYPTLSLDDKLLYIECLARTGEGYAALKKLEKIVPEGPLEKDFYACCGWVYLSRGEFQKAEHFINRSLELDNHSQSGVLAKVMLFLYLKQFFKSEILFEDWLAKNPVFIQSFQTFLVGVEVYNATRKVKKLYNWYSKRAKLIKNEDKLTYDNLKASSRLYKGIRGKQLFEIVTESDSVEYPLAESSDCRFYFIFFQLKKNRNSKILLDTGNATGWMVHDRELYDYLDMKKGGRTVAVIGSEADVLDGYRIYTESLDFGSFQFRHLTGFYIPKPRSDFFDANLNPLFIRNRVVTLDGPGKRFIMRTKRAFDRYLLKKDGRKVVKLRWYGYEQAFIPLEINGVKKGLGIIETGAEDIAVLLDFARLLQLPLKPKVKYLSNGSVYRFFKAPVTIYLGSLKLNRSAADVWSFDRFYRRLSGLKAGVVLGPGVFKDTCVLSFDPFAQEIVVEW